MTFHRVHLCETVILLLSMFSLLCVVSFPPRQFRQQHFPFLLYSPIDSDTYVLSHSSLRLTS